MSSIGASRKRNREAGPRIAGDADSSSNTTLEPVTTTLLGGLPEVSAQLHLQFRTMVREVLSGPAAQRPEAIAILCTNLKGAPLVEALEEEFGVPVYDSIATVVWKSLQLAGVDTLRVAGWGRLFQTLA